MYTEEDVLACISIIRISAGPAEITEVNPSPDDNRWVPGFNEKDLDRFPFCSRVSPLIPLNWTYLLANVTINNVTKPSDLTGLWFKVTMWWVNASVVLLRISCKLVTLSRGASTSLCCETSLLQNHRSPEEIWQGHKRLHICIYTSWIPAHQILGAIQIILSSGLSHTHMNHAQTWLIFSLACSPVIIRNVYIDNWFVSLSDVADQTDEQWFMKWGGAESLTHLYWLGLIGRLCKFVLEDFFFFFLIAVLPKWHN